MLDEDVVEAERVRGVRRVAALGALDVAEPIERDLPDRSPRGVGDEQVAVLGERDAVRDDRLRRARRVGADRAADPGRDAADVVAHGGNPEGLHTGAAPGSDRPDGADAPAAVARPEVAEKFRDQLAFLRLVLECRHRREEIALLGEALGADRPELR